MEENCGESQDCARVVELIKKKKIYCYLKSACVTLLDIHTTGHLDINRWIYAQVLMVDIGFTKLIYFPQKLLTILCTWFHIRNFRLFF